MEQWRNALQICSTLLRYPDQSVIRYIDSIRHELESLPPYFKKRISDFIEYYTSRDIIGLQEEYVETFDMNEKNSLYLTYHKTGEGEDRGEDLLRIKNLYSLSNFSPQTSELPDYLPLFLEFLSVADPKTAGQAIKVYGSYVSIIADNLKKSKSPYYMILDACIYIFSQIQKGGKDHVFSS